MFYYHGKIANEEYLKRDVIRKKQACIRQQKKYIEAMKMDILY